MSSVIIVLLVASIVGAITVPLIMWIDCREVKKISATRSNIKSNIKFGIVFGAIGFPAIIIIAGVITKVITSL